ncbi:lactadherin-like [Argopecten irradians]|uniref:lactadherin-like n=1 Tax=Argopecten irradians TaxID=31199 RepID=UPI00371FF319
MKTIILVIILLPLVINSCAGCRCRPCEYNLVTGPYGVPDNALSASSTHSSCHIVYARFSSDSAWCPGSTGGGHYIQVELKNVSKLTAVQTRGRGGTLQWVSFYSVNISMDGSTWNYIFTPSGEIKVFDGNVDSTSTVTNILEGNIVAKYIRVISVGNDNRFRSMKLEVQGCPVSMLSDTCPKWEAKKGSSGDIFSVLEDTNASNHGTCGIVCYKWLGCDNFLFNVGSTRCTLFDSTSSLQNQTLNLDGVWYFRQT